MADDKPVEQTQDSAKQAAEERMKAALDAKKRGEEIEVDSASLEATTEDAQTSGTSDAKKTKTPGDGKTIDEVKVYSPFHVYYDGPANSVSAVNQTGPFDILHDHKNFMSLLIPCDVVIRHERGEDTVKIDRGVMHVADNKVIIFLDV